MSYSPLRSKEKALSSRKIFKKIAKQLRLALESECDQPLSHSRALELLATYYGFSDWHHCDQSMKRGGYASVAVFDGSAEVIREILARYRVLLPPYGEIDEDYHFNVLHSLFKNGLSFSEREQYAEDFSLISYGVDLERVKDEYYPTLRSDEPDMNFRAQSALYISAAHYIRWAGRFLGDYNAYVDDPSQAPKLEAFDSYIKNQWCEELGVLVDGSLLQELNTLNISSK